MQSDAAAVTACECYSMPMMPPSMYFHIGYREVVLFHWWKVETAVEYVLTCLAVCVAAFLLEFLISLRHRFEARKRQHRKPVEIRMQPQEGEMLEEISVERSRSVSGIERVLKAMDATCLHILSLILAYPLMLVVMTFNYGLVLSVILGAGVGYFFFSGMRAFSQSGDQEPQDGGEMVREESGCH